MTLDVLPGHPAAYGIAVRDGNTIPASEITVRPSERSKFAHLNDLILGEANLGVILTPRRALSTLRELVEIVVSPRAKEQMAGVDTRLNVAFVENAKPAGNGAEVKLPAESMGESRSFLPSDLTVSVWPQSARPQPASGAAVALIQKLFKACEKNGIVHNSHVNLLCRLAGPRVLQHHGGFVVPSLHHAIKEA